jgi:uncharacterized membrane protein
MSRNSRFSEDAEQLMQGFFITGIAGILSNYPAWEKFLYPALGVCLAAALLFTLALIIKKLFGRDFFGPFSSYEAFAACSFCCLRPKSDRLQQ